MDERRQKITEAAASIRDRWGRTPKAGIVLGTGLGAITRSASVEAVVPYQAIPHFPRSQAMSHTGQLVCGLLADVPVLIMEGRTHIYEGYSAAETAFPVHVMGELGVRLLIVCNAAGGMNPHLACGDIMVVEDHINLLNDNPLIGCCADRNALRFTEMRCPYHPALTKTALAIARQEGFPLQQGVYVALSGPNYETRAEYRFLRQVGGDVVGMSTVPEVIAASHAGLRVLGLSVVTNICHPDRLEPTTGEEVVATAGLAAPKIRRIILGVLADYAAGRIEWSRLERGFGFRHGPV